jgi:uncharacterized repeat protein (TIGR01451 family)
MSIRLAACAALLSFVAPSVHAAAWGVSSTTDTAVGAACPGFTGCSLRGAITAANANPGPDAILVSAGTYVLANGEINITDDLTISRVGAGAVTIDANVTSRIFLLGAVDVTISNMTLTRAAVSATGDGFGGAISAPALSTLELVSVNINNSQVAGSINALGGAVATAGSLIISGTSVFESNRTNAAAVGIGGAIAIGPGGRFDATGARFASNSANGVGTEGGALSIMQPSAPASCVDCVFTENVASCSNFTSFGGAIAISGGDLSLTRTVVGPGNFVAAPGSAAGGGISLRSGRLTLNRSAVFDNDTQSNSNSRGGGIAITTDSLASVVEINGSTIANNSVTALTGGAIVRGGGIDMAGPQLHALTLRRDTITGNSLAAAPGNASAAAIGADTAGGVWTMGASLISGNGTAAVICSGTSLQSVGYNIVQSGCPVVAAASDIVVDTVLLAPAADNGGNTITARVLRDTPAHDYIPPGDAACTDANTDQRGSTRPFGAGCEPGAFELQLIGDLGVTIDDGTSTAVSGGTTTYQINVFNTGPEALTGATLTVPASPGHDKTSVVCAAIPSECTTAPTIAALETGGFALPTLDAGDTFVIDIVTHTTATSGTVALTATVTPPAGGDNTPANNTAGDVNGVDIVAELSVTKDDGVVTVQTGDAIVYDIVVTNAGPSAVTGAVLTDAGATGATLGTVSCGSPTCTTPPTLGELQTGVALPTLAAGATYRITIAATVTAQQGTVSNTASVAAPGGATDPAPNNNSATDTDALGDVADLGSSKTAPPTYAPGETFDFVLTLSNAGPGAAANASMTDVLPAQLRFESLVANQPGYTCTTPAVGANGTVTCTTPSLAAGATHSFTLRVSTAPTETAAITNTMTVTSPTTDPNPANGSDSVTVTAQSVAGGPIEPVPGLSPLALAVLGALMALVAIARHRRAMRSLGRREYR